MCDSITNGGYIPVITIPPCPPSNVIIASNVLSTNGNVLCANIISGDGTFTGNLLVTGQIFGIVTYSVLNVAQVINTGSIISGSYSGNGYDLSTLNASNLLGVISNVNLPVTGVVAGQYGSSANVSQVSVDQYGRITTASNVAILSSQWTSVAGNVAYANGVSIGTLAAPPVGSNLYVLGKASMTTLFANTLNVFGISNLNYIIGDGGGISNVNSSRLVGTIPSSLILGNTLSNLNASNLAFGIVPSSLILGNTLSNIQASNITQPFTNLVVSNTVTTNNAAVGNTLTVTGAMTSNAANTTFFYDTFTIPYINSKVTNASSISTINIIASQGNVTTLNVQSLFANSMTVYGANTLNVFGISNLNSVVAVSIIGNGSSISSLNSSNLIGTLPSSLILGNTLSNIQASAVTQPFVNLVVGTLNVSSISNLNSLTLTSNLVVGPTPSTIQANLHVERGDVFIGNSAITNTNFTTTGSVFRLKFDNSSNTSLSANEPNKIILFSNVAGGIYCGVGVTGASSGGCSVGYYAATHHIFYNGAGFTAGGWTNSSTLSVGGINAGAKLYVFGSAPSSTNIHVRVDSSNIALVTSGGNRVGINTLAPSANLHVIGNIYSTTDLVTANSVQSANLIVTTANVGTLNVATISNLNSLVLTNNLVAANSVTTTNLLTTTANVGTLNVIQISNLANLTISNTLTTTNIVAAGFTSSSSNTIFNFDTLTIPFINSTTLNVASTANIDLVTITGEPGLTSLFVTGNVYASNALTAPTVFAATEVLTGTTGATTLNVTGNLYVSNALTTTNVFAATVSTTNPIPFRNRIINGGMTVWQRNTATITTTASLYTTADRWCGALGTSGLLLSQWPGPTEAPQFPYSLQVTTSTTTTGVPLVEQRIENQNIPDFLNGTPVSVSFYAGQPYGTLMPLTVGLYYATAVNNFGTQTLAVAATKNTPTLTTANVYYTLNFTLTTSLSATNGLSLRFTTGGASAIGSTILLTGVQVEKGLVATPFEVRPYSAELALAQRYYYQLTSPTAAVQGSAQVYAIFGTATGITTTAFWLPLQFPVPMRTPNYTFSNSAVTNFQLLPTGTTTITGVGVQSDSYTPVGATLNFVGTNITVGGSYIFRTNGLTGSTTAFFGFSCEL